MLGKNEGRRIRGWQRMRWSVGTIASMEFEQTPGVYSNSCIESVIPSKHLILCHPLLLPPSIFPSIRVFSDESAFHIRWPKLLEPQLQHQSFQWIVRVDLLQDSLVWSPCSPRDSQESSPAAQFKSINSLALSFIYGPILTSVHDYLLTSYFMWPWTDGLFSPSCFLNCKMRL